jgi:hypothetical protein
MRVPWKKQSEFINYRNDLIVIVGCMAVLLTWGMWAVSIMLIMYGLYRMLMWLVP